MKRLVAPALPAVMLLCVAPAAAQEWRAAPAAAAVTTAATPIAGPGRAPINIGLSAAEVTWHVRAALNVAALACRDAADAGTADAYNRMIEAESRPLADADAGVKAQYRARYGVEWEPMHDRDMTRLYNYFAQPTAHDGLCAAARDILAQADGLSPIEFGDFAAWALPRLDAPFTAAYRREQSDATRMAAIPPPSGVASSGMPSPNMIVP